MQRIEFDFVARRYHATPWDAHVNEGRVEWPPCPWRLLRSLIAVGYNKLGWSTVPAVADSLLKALSTCSPTFYLPTATETHTRHYMPIRKGRSESRARIFDAYLRFADGQTRMIVEFDCDLSPEERELFRDLLEGMAYLGRAESWVDATLVDDVAKDETLPSQATDTDLASLHRVSVDTTDASQQIVRLLGPLEDAIYSQWRSEETEHASLLATQKLKNELAEKGKKASAKNLKTAATKAQSIYPLTLADALQVDTSDWQSEGWARPPGSQWLDYRVPDGMFNNAPLRFETLDPPYDPPQAILLAIDGQGKRGSLRPSVKRALPLMELLHAKAVWYADHKLGADLAALPELTGQDAAGKPLRGDHFHAHWIPLSLRQTGHIDHVLVYSSRGFSKDSVKAITGLRTSYSKGLKKLGVNAVGEGSIADIRNQLLGISSVPPDSVGMLVSGKVFESCTPLVFRKYTSNRGKKRADNQIREELAERGLPEPASIKFWENSRALSAGLKGFVLRRQKKKAQPPMERSWGVTLSFEQIVDSVPLALGYGSHLGLGLFKCVDTKTANDGAKEKRDN